MIKVNIFSKPITILFHYHYLLSIPLSKYLHQCSLFKFMLYFVSLETDRLDFHTLCLHDGCWMGRLWWCNALSYISFLRKDINPECWDTNTFSSTIPLRWNITLAMVYFQVGQILGTKIFLTEIMGFLKLGEYISTQEKGLSCPKISVRFFDW